MAATAIRGSGLPSGSSTTPLTVAALGMTDSGSVMATVPVGTSARATPGCT
jgi:hypothetical protein